MTMHRTATREDWLKARLALLEAEKALTRQSDALAQQRQALPWVRVDKNYTFETEAGTVSLKDLFRGRSQLIVYHFMFGPDFAAGCPSCSAIADGFNGIAVHLENHDVAFTAVSRAPISKLLAYRRRMGWDFPWASSFGSDFNFDYAVSFTEQQQKDGSAYNYRPTPPMMGVTAPPVMEIAAGAGTDAASFMRERPGMSSFVLDGGAVYHTYSAYSRGVDGIWSMYAWLDRAPRGRNEHGIWWRRHDEYERPVLIPRASCCGA